ncbi:MAG: class I SAM-dependent methyltransferase, partial [Anaerolineae bacterium]
MDVVAYNRQAWNQQVEQGNPWTVPFSAEVIAEARQGRWAIVLTPTIPVPRSWFPDPLSGRDVLCLASGGGQQGPVLAAAGAQVTVFDNSPAQLARDREVAEREGLAIRTVQGDMADLSAFAAESFDLIFHPVSNLFAPDVRPVWRECYRVLRLGGALLAGFANPVRYLFDVELADQ